MRKLIDLPVRFVQTGLQIIDHRVFVVRFRDRMRDDIIGDLTDCGPAGDLTGVSSPDAVGHDIDLVRQQHEARVFVVAPHQSFIGLKPDLHDYSFPGILGSSFPLCILQ